MPQQLGYGDHPCETISYIIRAKKRRYYIDVTRRQDRKKKYLNTTMDLIE
jgi:hypothetical protein